MVTALALLGPSLFFTVTLVLTATFFGASFDFANFRVAVLLFAAAFFLAGFLFTASFFSPPTCLIGVALLPARRFESFCFLNVFLLAVRCAV